MALKDIVPLVPAVPINRYLWSKIAELDPDLVMSYNGIMPFYPLGDSAAGDAPWDQKPNIVYDRMMTINSNPFYPIKKEQIHYALKALPSDSLTWGSAIQYILDRMDDAAQEVNEYNADMNYGLFSIALGSSKPHHRSHHPVPSVTTQSISSTSVDLSSTLSITTMTAKSVV